MGQVAPQGRLEQPLNLAYWQERLAAHFAKLREGRGDWPIFALEHGLEARDCQALKDAVRAAIRAEKPRSDQSLAWVVYATEFGYKYSGESYWPAFEEETPGWREQGNRDFIRTAFERFAKHYKGVQPRSLWAQHFSIICWPITHAVLPTDLQRRLVQLLFQLRFSFNRSLFASAEDLGRYLHSHIGDTSSRFQELAENESLLGQIAAGLLLEASEAESLILPATLQRVRADIERERVAKTWLSEARARIGRLQVRGLGGVQSQTRTARSRHSDAGIRLEPRLSLVQNAEGAWSAWVRLPSLAPIATIWPEVRPFLASARAMLLDGDEERPLARGKLLSGSDERLTQWPDHGAPYLHVEDAPTTIEAVLQGMIFPARGTTFFQVTEHGRAVHALSGKVRPGESYILVSRSPIDGAHLGISPVKLGFSGAHGSILAVPDHLDDQSIRRLELLGTAADRHVRIWPSGAGVAAWDDEGYCEVLTGDPLILGLAVDHAVTGLRITIDDGPTRHFSYGPAGDSVAFVCLDELNAGEHIVVLQLAHDQEVTDLGRLSVVVRAPGATGRTASTTGAIVLRAWPPQPSLEQLWEGSTEVSVAGPIGIRASCSVELRMNDASQVLAKTAFTITLPCTVEDWRSAWQHHAIRDSRLAAKYDAAGTCTIQIDAGSLGQPSLIARRELAPLRWYIRYSDVRLEAQLLNDSETKLQLLEHFRFERPDTAVRLDPKVVMARMEIPAPGGLLIAETSNHRAATIGATPLVLKSLGGLAPEVVLRPLTRASADIVGRLTIAALWGGARIRGAQQAAALWRGRIVKQLVSQLVGTIAGEKWENAEKAVFVGKADVDDLISWIAGKPQHSMLDLVQVVHLSDVSPSAVTQKLVRICRRQLADDCMALGGHVRHTVGKGKVRRVDQSAWTCQFALRLCSAPHTIPDWAGDRTRLGIEQLLAHPRLLRAARYVHLALSLSGRHGPPKKEEIWVWE